LCENQRQGNYGMKISIITATYNSEGTIADTIASIRSQDYKDIEYIIVDGGSNDNTMDIIAKAEGVVTLSISEPDNGIYDALNKGLALATGDVVGILHSDDVFASENTISSVAAKFIEKKVDAVYSDLQYVDQNDLNKVIRYWKSCDYNPKLFYKGWMPAHPTFFLSKRCFDEYGCYDLSFFTSADYELMLRMFVRHKVKSAYIPKTLVKMRVGGQSNVTWKNRWIANQEDARAWKVNGLKARFYTRWMKPLSKIRQFVE